MAGRKGGAEVLKVGTLNVRGVNKEEKREEVGVVMEERKLDILALTETKLKGEGDLAFGKYKGMYAGVNERVRAREGVAIVMRDEWWSCVKARGRMGARIVWVRLRLRREYWVFICAYAPVVGANERERERFWESLSECVGSFDGRDHVCLLGDLNARVGVRRVNRVIGPFGVDGENENGIEMVGMCAARGLMIGNTWFENKENHKYTWVSDVNGERGLLDFVCVSWEWRSRLLDVNVLRGAAMGISDHYLVVAKIKVKGGWEKVGGRGRAVEIVRGERLEDEEKRSEYTRGIREKWEEVGGSEGEGGEKEWSKLKGALVEVARRVCGVKKLGNGRRKGSEWWNEEMENMIKRKKEAYCKYLSTREGRDWEEYRERCREVKREVKRAKKRVGEEWCRKLAENFKERSKMFWKEVNKARRGGEEGGEGGRGGDGEEGVGREVGVVVEGEREVGERWKRHFSDLLTGVGGEEVVENNEGMLLEEDGSISREEVRVAVGKVKMGKSAEMDGIYGEMIRVGGGVIVDWLVRMFNVCWGEGKVPQEWQDACVVPIYKGKGDKMACKNYRGISLLSVVGKIYGKVLVAKVKELTRERVGEEQGGVREGRGCVDQVFTLRMIGEKLREKDRVGYVCFMDLEKAYDRVCRKKLFEVLREGGVSGRLLNGIKSFYENCRARVRVRRELSDWFNVGVGLRQGCVMSPWLFNVLMDGVVRGMEREGKGIRLRSREGEWEVNVLLFADDAVLVAESGEKLRMLVKEFVRECASKGLRVNSAKSKVMRIGGGNEAIRGEEWEGVEVGGEKYEEVEEFKYLGMLVEGKGGMDGEIKNRVMEGMKVMGGLREVWKKGRISKEIKVRMFESMCLPSAMYGCETWVMNAQFRKRLEVFEMKGLRAVCGLRRVDRIRNERIREMCGWKRGIVGRAEEGVLRWFGHMCRMDENRMVGRVMRSDVEGGRGRGRPRMRWMDGVREILGE